MISTPVNLHALKAESNSDDKRRFSLVFKSKMHLTDGNLSSLIIVNISWFRLKGNNDNSYKHSLQVC